MVFVLLVACLDLPAGGADEGGRECGSGSVTTWYRDADGDHFGDVGLSVVACEAPAGFVTDSADCDDQDARINPEGVEVCDGADENCNGLVDESPVGGVDAFPDRDYDGWGDANGRLVVCMVPEGFVIGDGDCADQDPARHPGVDEVCDGVDQDCDGEVDDSATDAPDWYRDADRDFYGDFGDLLADCSPPVGYVADRRDCDDTDPGVHPDATEHCDGRDEDCDTRVDEGAADTIVWYRDDDEDGYGDRSTQACEAPDGYVASGGDCDERDATVHPGAPEVVGDTVDQDCDGAVTCYADSDRDGHGGMSVVSSWDGSCYDAGEARTATDCDDTLAAAYPGAPETPYDGVDQDCDGADIVDVDADGYDAEAVGGPDCDDTNATVNPVAAERCDFAGIDDDCDGLVDGSDPDLGGVTTWYADADADGAGDPASSVVATCAPDGWVAVGDDCDDTDAGVAPGATETCDDSVDLNCDGRVGDTDGDGDGWTACEDCDDTNPDTHPGASETGNGRDDDCDRLQDEYPGNLEIASLAEAVVFCSSYAGVEGDLSIDGLPDLRDLACLRSVSGDVRFSGVSATSMAGLEALREVGGNLMIGGWVDEEAALVPSAFQTLDGLDRLSRLGGDLWVAENDVADLGGLARLAGVDGSVLLWGLPATRLALPTRSIGGDLWIENLPALTEIDTPSLEVLGGSVWLSSLGWESAGFVVTLPAVLSGSLGLVDLPPGSNAGWVGPERVGALYVENTSLADLSGMEGLLTVDGEVVIQGNPNLADLSALDGVNWVGGDVALLDNAALVDGGSFDALTHIGGWLRVSGEGPEDLAGFGALTELGSGLELGDSRTLLVVSGLGSLVSTPTLMVDNVRVMTSFGGLGGVSFTQDVVVTNNAALADLGGLAAVKTLSGSLTIEDNRSLRDLAGLGGLTSVGGAVTLRDLDALVDGRGLANLTTVGGAVSLIDLPDLDTLDFASLVTIGGDLALEDLPALGDLSAFSALEQAGGVGLLSLDGLADLDGLQALVEVDGSVVVESNDGLVSLAGLDRLMTVGEDFRVDRNRGLLDVTGVDALVSVGRDLTLLSNDAMTTFGSFGAMVSVGRDLWIDGNRSLLDLEGFGELEVGNSIWIARMGALSSLDGLDGVGSVPNQLALYQLTGLTDITALGNLTEVGGNLRVAACTSLLDLHGLDQLTNVGGNLEIGYQASWAYPAANPSLTSLDGLGALVAVGGDLWIEDNVLLGDISALDTLERVGGDLGVRDNPVLPTTDAEGLADGDPVVGGTITISGNG